MSQQKHIDTKLPGYDARGVPIILTVGPNILVIMLESKQVQKYLKAVTTTIEKISNGEHKRLIPQCYS